jgi:hypothetical protein
MALQHVTGSSNQLVSTTSGDDVQVSTSTLPQNEPSIALNPSNPEHLVAGANDQLSSGAVWLAVYTSSNGGTSWTNGQIPATGALAGFQEASDPGVSFSQNGTLYYSGVAFNIDRRSGAAVDGTIFVSKSTDDGSSFPLTTIVALGSNRISGIFNDKPYLTVDETTGLFAGRVYVSWTRFTSASTSDIVVAYSSDGGTSFSSPLPVSNSLLNQGSVPVVGPNGTLYVVWNDLSNLQIMVAKSTDGGVSFSGPVIVSTYFPLPSHFPNSLFRLNNNPTAATDDTNGNVYVSWADYGNGYAVILSSRSVDGGATWSKAIRVNDDSTTNDHFFPWMTVSHGLLSIVFYDRRLDPQNHLVDVFYAESADGGSSFSPNVRVTDVSFNPDAIIFSSGQSFIGDYIGIASNGTLAHPVWTDNRNVSPTNPGSQEIFAEGRRVDRPPVVDPIGNQVVYPGAELRFGVKATDPDVGETLSLVDLGAPSGATFTSTPSTNGTVGGSFDWTPSAVQAGNYSVEFRASDGFLTSGANVSVMVKTNSPPSLVVPGPQTVTAGSMLTFIVSATDPDARPDFVTISCDSCAQLGATFDSSTGNFTWVPASGQGPGDYSANFTATDHLLPSLSDSKTVSITVVEVEQPPVLTVPGAQTVEAGNLLIFSVSATNPDVDVSITLSASGLPLGATFDPDLGSFVWTPSNDQGPGVYTVTFKAVEPGPQGFSDTKTVTITVTQPASSSGQPSGTGDLGPGLWLVAGVTVLVSALVSTLAIRARRGKKGSDEGAKISSYRLLPFHNYEVYHAPSLEA